MCLQVLACVRDGRHGEALRMQQRLNPLARAVTSGHGIAGLKAAMDFIGYDGGEPREPLLPLSADALEQIRLLVHSVHA